MGGTKCLRLGTCELEYIHGGGASKELEYQSACNGSGKKVLAVRDRDQYSMVLRKLLNQF